VWECMVGVFLGEEVSVCAQRGCELFRVVCMFGCFSLICTSDTQCTWETDSREISNTVRLCVSRVSRLRWPVSSVRQRPGE
jgi:hypothetical protein